MILSEGRTGRKQGGEKECVATHGKYHVQRKLALTTHMRVGAPRRFQTRNKPLNSV
ncbi:hypothetical protein thalar_00727 [Litoreibacter arenae DSM 19593]|uniref:Uncharacterized protein n=1 Tax=Litoreibacter arenae DSM 19593 TaxID=1123360 RepID=S9QNJ0_9RHOB|nr:hypothetical protein thalar_00727 [Litoreibacter arenae DSM 19593]